MKITRVEAEYNQRSAKSAAGAATPYQRAALHALRELTGRDASPTPQAWRELLGLRKETERGRQ